MTELGLTDLERHALMRAPFGQLGGPHSGLPLYISDQREPLYVPQGRNRALVPVTALITRDPNRDKRKTEGKHYHQIEAAISRDILGHTDAQLANRIGLSYGQHDRDHILASNRQGECPSPQATRGERSKPVEDRRKKGRRLLHELGAWPWAHAPEGRLPRDWRSQADTFWYPIDRWRWHTTNCHARRLEYQQEVFEGRIGPNWGDAAE